MLFEVDRQTTRDLNLFDDRSGGRSVFSVYNRTITKGGRDMLYKLFHHPVSDLEFLQCRREEINFFFQNNCSLLLHSKQTDFIEHYLSNDRAPLRSNYIDAAYNGLMNILSSDGNYWIISNGIFNTLQLLNDLQLFILDASIFELPETLEADFRRISQFLQLKPLRTSLEEPPADLKELTFIQINFLDQLLRVSQKAFFRQLLDIVYKIDVLQSLARIMKSDGYTLPHYMTCETPHFEVTDAINPILPAAVPNSFSFEHQACLCFLTGPNMAGKSTFLKTMGLMVYLSHLGFPVPAKNLKTTLFDGLFTTINLTDNLNLGFSHFYSEVHRVKEIALKINSDKHLLVIFDELFRGTNVKDAFDASLMIISALADIKGNLFFISTHLLEVAEELEKKEAIVFNCFESELVQQVPVYDYKLKSGVSSERIGIHIIQQEGIVQLLREISEKQRSTTPFN